MDFHTTQFSSHSPLKQPHFGQTRLPLQFQATKLSTDKTSFNFAAPVATPPREKPPISSRKPSSSTIKNYQPFNIITPVPLLGEDKPAYKNLNSVLRDIEKWLGI